MESPEDKASYEATCWLVELQEDPHGARERFEAWHRASPLNATAWAETLQLSSVAAHVTPSYRHVWAPDVSDLRAKRPAGRRFGVQRWRKAVAALALAACIGFFVVPSLLQRLGADYVSETAQARKVTLTDGSEIVLAPASAISVSYSAGAREVRLLSGEAFFQVTPDLSRPFRVVARAVETVVVGTSFDVAVEAAGVTVSVEHGIVRVRPVGAAPTTDWELRSGRAVRVQSDGQATQMRTAPELVGAWRNGQLVAQNMTMREAIDQIRRYWGGVIILSDSALGDRRITGAYNLLQPEDALRGIALAHGGKVRRITPWVLVVSPL